MTVIEALGRLNHEDFNLSQAGAILRDLASERNKLSKIKNTACIKGSLSYGDINGRNYNMLESKSFPMNI